MAKKGDLKACLANLRELQARSDIEPEQKTAIEVMMGRIRKLARLQNPTRRDVFRCVREVTGLLTKTFLRRR
jgi:hypothetical protein